MNQQKQLVIGLVLLIIAVCLVVLLTSCAPTCAEIRGGSFIQTSDTPGAPMFDLVRNGEIVYRGLTLAQIQQCSQ